jgi:hypothetical protein
LNVAIGLHGSGNGVHERIAANQIIIIIDELRMKIENSFNFFGFLEFDLVGYPVMHPIQNPKKLPS